MEPGARSGPANGCFASSGISPACAGDWLVAGAGAFNSPGISADSTGLDSVGSDIVKMQNPRRSDSYYRREGL